MFVLEELRGEVWRCLSEEITVENYLELSSLAERHRSACLVAACARYTVGRAGEVNWARVGQMPELMAAVAKQAMQVGTRLLCIKTLLTF